MERADRPAGRGRKEGDWEVVGGQGPLCARRQRQQRDEEPAQGLRRLRHSRARVGQPRLLPRVKIQKREFPVFREFFKRIFSKKEATVTGLRKYAACDDVERKFGKFIEFGVFGQISKFG